MYSRKSIRAYQPMTRYLPSETDEAEATITPPPDYTGVAFYSRQEADYPEARIPPMEEEETDAEASAIEAPQETEPPLVPDDPIPPLEKEEEAPPTDGESILPESPAPDSPSAPLPPLITPAWLRSLTVEDILLFWLILQLLSGEPEDQIYLLLGLLLFAGR